MTISTKYFNYLIYAASLTGLSYMMYQATQDTKSFKGIYDLKIEIAHKDPKRFDSLMHDGIQRHSFIDWQYEVNKMNDSLRTDSLAKRAYFEGEQRIRDSIKNKERADKHGI